MVSIAFYCDSDYRVYKDRFINDFDEEYSRFAKNLRLQGHRVHTLDVFCKAGWQIDICICFDVPVKFEKFLRIIKKFNCINIVWLREPYNVCPWNYDATKLKEYDFVQTWKSDLWDFRKFFPYNCTRILLEGCEPSYVDFDKRNFACMINANKMSSVPGELYSLRRKYIDWYGQNHPCMFDLYGFRWERRYFFGNKVLRALNRLKIPNILTLYQPPRCWRGAVQNKATTLSSYKFCFAFENTSGEKDYLSEKIFDCFRSRTVPVYIGCPNIKDLIDPLSFIDGSQFETPLKCFEYLQQISAKEYDSMIEAGQNVLKSKLVQDLSEASWVSRNSNVINLAIKNVKSS